MNVDILCRGLNQELTARQSRPLNSVESLLIRGIWQYQTYSQIAEAVGYSPGYLTNVVAPELLHRLSDLVGQRLTKKNCRLLLQEYVAAQTGSPFHPPSPPATNSFTPTVHSVGAPAFPSGPLAIASPFYIPRPPIESQVCEEIDKPGALVRVKAPKEMGKTSLLLRALHYGEQSGYRTVYLNLEQLDQAICADLNRFLRSLCASVSRQLQLEPKLDDYWDADVGSKVSCTLYFRQYLLETVKAPLVLALDELHQIFAHPQIARDVLPLLRSWFEEAKRVPIWQNLRLMIAHSTEAYVPLQLNESPFNAGLATQLDGFTLAQVQQLAQLYSLNWASGGSTERLMALVGGHPALIHLALYHLKREDLTLDQLLATASTPRGIYHHHLQRHWAILKQQPTLLRAFQTLLNINEPLYLESNLAYQLSSMGLVKHLQNKVTVSCELYRQYYQARILATTEIY
jgi:hypothetical protein